MSPAGTVNSNSIVHAIHGYPAGSPGRPFVNHRAAATLRACACRERLPAVRRHASLLSKSANSATWPGPCRCPVEEVAAGTHQTCVGASLSLRCPIGCPEGGHAGRSLYRRHTRFAAGNYSCSSAGQGQLPVRGGTSCVPRLRACCGANPACCPALLLLPEGQSLCCCCCCRRSARGCVRASGASAASAPPPRPLLLWEAQRAVGRPIGSLVPEPISYLPGSHVQRPPRGAGGRQPGDAPPRRHEAGSQQQTQRR